MTLTLFTGDNQRINIDDDDDDDGEGADGDKEEEDDEDNADDCVQRRLRSQHRLRPGGVGPLKPGGENINITMIKMRNAFKVEGGGVDGELIYENTAVLKSNAYLTPVTTAIEKYQFGGHEEEDEDEDDDDAGGEKEEDEVEEEEEEEEDPKDSEGVAVPFPPLDLTSNSSSDGVERSSSKLWGVRSNGGANGFLGPQVNISPTIIRPTIFILLINPPVVPHFINQFPSGDQDFKPNRR